MVGPILEVVDVHFAYPDGTQALAGMSLTIERGSKVVFLGPNGAGKTTLFLQLNGILRPSQGVVRFDGNDLRYDRRSLMELRKNVGIVFQDPDSQIFSASVLQDISFGPFNLGMSEEEVRGRVQGALAAVGIESIADRPTHFLSLGQKKRVAIAGVLAMEPQVIIFDEPTSSLDPKTAKQLLILLDNISRDGKTVVISTHDVDIAYSWADRVYVLESGRVADARTPQEIFLDEAMLERVDLTQPWIVDVWRELRDNGYLPPNALLPRTKSALLALIRSRLCHSFRITDLVSERAAINERG